MTAKRVSQAEIARVAGVSVSTVSRVLSNAPGISAPVRAKVTSIARELGYRFTLPGMVAGTALSRVVLFVGQLRRPGGLGLVYNAMLAGIRDVADRAGIAVTFATEEAGGRLPRHLLNEPGAAFLFLGIEPETELLRALRARRVPVVLVNGADPEMIVDAVAPANHPGGRLAARHLVERGHRRILQLSHRRRWILRRRSDGFASGVSEFGGGAEVVAVELDSLDEASVYRAAPRWLPLLSEGVTAIFCGNDVVGMSTLQLLKGEGIAVPGDVAVIGFDDSPVAEMADPALTTVRLDWQAIGAEAMRLVTLRLADPGAPAREVQLGATLVIRQST
jgi:DNA-binding LacI/PurR family transcriptional regulator